MQPTAIQRLRAVRAKLESLSETLAREEAAHGDESNTGRCICNRPGVLVQSFKGETVSRHEVFVRNLGVNGASVLHGVFLQSRTPCTLVLITDEREPVAVEATVSRCRHVDGQVHDLGLTFVEALTEPQAKQFCVPAAGAPLADAVIEPERFRSALSRCTELSRKLRHLVLGGADADEVIPLIDELGSLEAVTLQAA